MKISWKVSVFDRVKTELDKKLEMKRKNRWMLTVSEFSRPFVYLKIKQKTASL